MDSWRGKTDQTTADYRKWEKLLNSTKLNVKATPMHYKDIISVKKTTGIYVTDSAYVTCQSRSGIYQGTAGKTCHLAFPSF